MVESTYTRLLEGSLISDLEKWIQYLDSARRFQTPIHKDNITELKELLTKALAKVEELENGN